MTIDSLAYIGVGSDKLDDWREFATRLLGMQHVARGGKEIAFRMDERAHRLVVTRETPGPLAFIGWEVKHKADLDAFGAVLEDAGFPVEMGSRELADQRRVDELVVTRDPEGNRVELAWRLATANTSFESGRPISGFLTGVLGMGHVVLNVAEIEPTVAFYSNLLGFRLSDYGLSPYPLYFFHLNARHHSFALVGSGVSGLHHFMVEYRHFDDVGQGFDLAQLNPECIAYTLGRHSNDYMTSYYAHSPSGFFVESGWGGRQIDPATWQAHETTDGPSFWGHERLYLPDGPRTAMRDLRLKAAAAGRRAPAIADCPWLYNDYLEPGRERS